MIMKKMIVSLSLMLIAASAFGQDGKPTKAQTIEYVQTNYPRSLGYVAARPDSDGRIDYDGEISDLSFAIIGTTITVRYLDLLKSGAIYPEFTTKDHEEFRVQHHITFDLKEIEVIQAYTPQTIGQVKYDEADVGLFPMYLCFMAAGGKQTVSHSRNGETKQENFALIPFTWDDTDDSHRVHREFKDSQLYKAIEHLRKLSGAPEPIRF